MNRQHGFFLGLIVLLVILPLWLIVAPDPFVGADVKAQALIRHIAPDYVPWFDPLFAVPAGEIESLLFALQAALGAGFLGFWLGGALMRERLLQQRLGQKSQAMGAEDAC